MSSALELEAASSTPTLDDVAVERYLRRLGVDRPTMPNLTTLRELHRRHQVLVPYNNLAIHLNRHVSLDPQWLNEWALDGDRGGMCYELNAAFGMLLASIGYQVDVLAARMILGDYLAYPYSHIALRVLTEDGSGWLADVGFGRHAHYPLRLDRMGEQVEPGGVFHLSEVETGDIKVQRDGDDLFQLDLKPRQLDEFEPTFWWMRTAQHSPYVDAPVCSRLTEDGGRITISGRMLQVTDASGERRRTTLGDGELLEAYHTHFGLTLDRIPQRTDGDELAWFSTIN